MRQLFLFSLLLMLTFFNKAYSDNLPVHGCQVELNGEMDSGMFQATASSGILEINGSYLNANKILNGYGGKKTSHVPLPTDWKQNGPNQFLGSSHDAEIIDGVEYSIHYGFEINNKHIAIARALFYAGAHVLPTERQVAQETASIECELNVRTSEDVRWLHEKFRIHQ